ncbi:hypothetical protein IFM89_031014 [Coptis chinensis]|uniref:Cytochrome P450 n=1 Tax=Coptis chinensis TaxID=261450 RepID=A0A835LJ66_9MAGN|nr:hypothetical protein IFM89_031014 [Coptis chinensis]
MKSKPVEISTLCSVWSSSATTHDTIIKATCGKAKDELDAHVGKGRHVNESDIHKPLLSSSHCEGNFKVIPLFKCRLPPHESMEDCHNRCDGYIIPLGTTVIVNLWKLPRDPQVWSDPLEFRSWRDLSRVTWM